MAGQSEVASEQVVYMERAGNGMAVAGFVCALIGAFAGLIPILFWIALPLGVLGLVFGAVGRRRANANPVVGKRVMAAWAIGLGIVAIGLGIIGVVIVNQAAEELDRDLQKLEKDFNSGP